MIWLKIWAIVIRVASPIYLLAVALLEWYLDVFESWFNTFGIVIMLHICILMHDKLPMRVIVIVKPQVINVNSQGESLLKSVMHDLGRLWVLEAVSEIGCRDGVFLVKFVRLDHGCAKEGYEN